jgi:hypothetical protein
MYPDFKELLSVLNAHEVRYLIVDGYAVSFHAEPRATKDLDILISADIENSRAIYAALAQFGAPVEGMSPADFTEPDNFFRMGTPPVMVDILPRISCVDFDEAWKRRVDVAIDDTLSAPFISRDDLLAAKLAAARPEDLADVAALGEARERNENERQHSLAGKSALDEMNERKRKAREDWLNLRQRQIEEGEPRTVEEAKAKGSEDWLKMRQRDAEKSQSPMETLEDQDHTLAPDQGGPSEGLGKDDDLGL